MLSSSSGSALAESVLGETLIEVTDLSPTALFPRRNGPLRQTAYLGVRLYRKQSCPVTIEVQLGGHGAETFDHVLHFGENKVRLAIPDITAPTPLRVTVRLAHPAAEAVWRGPWQPQRKWKVYLVKASHYDLGYDGRIDVMQNDAAEYIDLAKRLCSDRDQHHEWHYYLEHMRFIRAYETERSPAALRDLVEKYLKKGVITLLGNPGGPHFHWMDYEQLARASYPARREMMDRFGLDVPTLSVVDNPSASWSAYQSFAQAGFKYLLRFAQGFRGPGSLRELGAPLVAWMQGPNGRDRILCSFHDSYAQDLWLGDGGGYGANFVEEAALRLADHLRRMEAGAQGAYPYDVLIVPNYVDWEVPHENERALARWRADFAYPEMHWDDASAGLAHLEKNFSEQIPVISADTNNNSGDYSSIDPRTQGIKRRTTRLLAFTEGVSALAASRDGSHFHPGKDFNEQYINLVEYDEHCWPTMLEATDVNIFNTCITKKHTVERVAERMNTLLLPSLQRLAGAGRENSATQGLAVWNPLGRVRSGLVDWQAPADTPAGCLIDPCDGREIPLQKIGPDRWQFIAEEVPAYGYRRYEFAALPPSGVAAEGNFRVVDDGAILSLQSRWYRIVFSREAGKITSLYSLALRRELLDPQAEYGFNGWVRCHAPVFSYDRAPKSLELSGIGRSTARLADCGSISAALEVRTTDEALGVDFTTRYVLYDHCDQLDVSNDVKRVDFLHTPAALRYTENIFICFPFRVPGFGFRVEYSPGVLDPATDLFASNTDFVVANRWVDVSGESFGITFVPHEAATIHLGQINYNQFRSEFQASSSHLYSYVWSNRMAGLTTLGLDDFKATLRYSIRAHAGSWSEGGAPAFGWQQASPLLAVAASGPNQASAVQESFLTVEDARVQIVILKRAERPGGGYVLRLVEVNGSDHECVGIRVGFGRIGRAWLCDGVENDRRELAVTPEGFVLPLGRFDVATVRFEMARPALPDVTGLEAVACGDSAVELSWHTQPASGGAEAIGFHIFRSDDPAAPPTLQTLVGYVEEMTYRDTGLSPGVRYCYRVAAATRHNHQGPVSDPVFARTTLENRTPPHPVRDLGVVPLDHDRVAVYWRRNDDPDLAHYEVHRSREAGFRAGPATQVAVVTPDRYELLVYTDTEVQAGETWYYRVWPVDFAGNRQEESACASGRTPTMKRFSERRYAP